MPHTVRDVYKSWALGKLIKPSRTSELGCLLAFFGVFRLKRIIDIFDEISTLRGSLKADIFSLL